MTTWLRYFSCLALLSCAYQAHSNTASLNLIEFDSKLIKITQVIYQKDKNYFIDDFGNILIVSQDNIKANVARKLLMNKLNQLKLNFSAQPAPYPGMFTKTQSCNNSVIFPKKINENKKGFSWAVEMPAAKDLSVGNCGAKEELYWARFFVLYCKEINRMFDVKLFSLRRDRKLHLSSSLIKCK